jgi:hypothetical protein
VKTFILIMLMYTPSAHTAGSVSGVEFANKASCEQAAAVAKKEFDGWSSTLYHVCVPKDATD